MQTWESYVATPPTNEARYERELPEPSVENPYGKHVNWGFSPNSTAIVELFNGARTTAKKRSGMSGVLVKVKGGPTLVLNTDGTWEIRMGKLT